MPSRPRKSYSIKTRTLFVVAIVMLGLLTVSAFALFTEKSSLLRDRQVKTRHLVEAVYGVLSYHYELQSTGVLSEAQAKTAAMNVIKALRYEKKEYFWINDMTPRVIMHPAKPELDGKDVSGLKDPTGKLVFVEFVDMVRKNGSGFVSYMWPKLGYTDPVPKLSYVQGFAPWGWVIGSGIYIDDIDTIFWQSAQSLLYVIAVLTLAIFVVLQLIMRSLAKSLGGEPDEAAEVANRIAGGDLSSTLVLRPGDTGSMMYAMKHMQDSLSQIVLEMREVVSAGVQGDFSKKMVVEGKQGFGREIAVELNLLSQSIDTVFQDTIRVAQALAKGDLSQKIMADYTGAFDDVKSNINLTVDALNLTVAEIRGMVEAANKGDFTDRLDIAGKQGYTLTLSQLLNHLSDNVDTVFKDIIRVSQALAHGDLTEKISREYQGAFNEVKLSVNETVENLTRLVSEVKEAIALISTASGEIASGNQDLSQRTEEQASSLEETASSMEELTSTVKQNAENAKHANQLAIGASDVAARGGEVVGQVVGTMSSIDASSRRIVDIIAVIDSIAFQTNILALNAAVEAARAGEQGRGFAVVASEVRSLAQRSAAAAKEIKSLIGDSVDKVKNGTALVELAGKTMEEIVASIGRVTHIMSEISTASGEQSQGIEQVNQAITQMDEVTQQNAALVEEAAAAAESMQEQAQNLAVAISVFRLSSNGRLMLK